MKKHKLIVSIGLFVIAFFGLFCIVQSFQSIVEKEQSLQDHPVKMRKFLLNKLWRDKAAGRLEKVKIHVQTLNDEDYQKQLHLKLIEEAQEVIAAVDNKDDLASEIGDVLEVLECIALFYNVSWQDVLDKKLAKQQDRGSYVERQYVTIAECAPDSWLLSYYMKDPKRNIEIFD